MDEMSQQAADDSQQTQEVVDSQMSVDQDGQESQSQMDTSTDDVEPSPQCSSPIPKQPKMHHEENPVLTTDSHVPKETEQDNGLVQNGNEVGSEESVKEKEVQLVPEKEEAQGKVEEAEGLDKKDEGLEKLKEDEGLEKVKEDQGLEQKDLSDSDMDEDEEDGTQFPKTLAEFNYAFNKEGRLRHIVNEEQGFKFDVRRNDHRYNQMHYEALGEVITEHIYELLETEAGLKKVYLDDNENEGSGFVFMSENALTTTDKLLILIHGSGVVRAGQWARRLIINDCLDSGTQIPYIQRAMKEGYEVLVMNTNDNFYIDSDGRRIWKEGSSSPNEHGLTVWDKFVANTPVKHVAIVAHSYGGVVTMDLATKKLESFGKVFAIAFTDSVHFMSRDRRLDTIYSWFVENAVNWVSSNKPLDTVIDDMGYDCKRVSAGTMKHEETSHYSIDSIFQFLATKEGEVKNIKPLNPRPEVAEPEVKETSDEVRKDVETEKTELKEEFSQGQETENGPADTQV
ncbi:cotranscriptional regulator FAM172A-like [Asterias rubens]|uniref:cotranscriptional regulator FAM172A-like n=1 Tax=Asterias rubens TaxID=7604 RepID=UPI001454F467|nr:cotranscriptional regulator FAM172A-like [Asterias rubens]